MDGEHWGSSPEETKRRQNGGQTTEESEPGAGDDTGYTVEYGVESEQSIDDIAHPEPETLTLPSTWHEEDHQLTTTIEYSIPETLARTVTSEANSEIRDSQDRKWPIEKEQPGTEPVTICQCNGGEHAIERGSAEGAVDGEYTTTETYGIRAGNRCATATEGHRFDRTQRGSAMADFTTTEVAATDQQANKHGAEDRPGTTAD
ncbi:hypothetical protein V494_05370 [Pseudogymnoascus sp. VKM F-4513 (FW-928)]|nr:hypothetical protein V494_05370 [Pseudogymnoascus sp. VKM F-4513 (FW-928)]